MGEVIDENELARHIRYRHQISRASWSSQDNLWTIDARRAPIPARLSVHRELPVDVPGLLPSFGGLHAATGMAWRPSTAGSFTRSMAGGPGLPRQEGCRDRLGRHRGDADPRDRGGLRACHDAAALADLFQGCPQCQRARGRCCGSWTSTRPGSTKSSAAKSCMIRTPSPAGHSPNRRP